MISVQNITLETATCTNKIFIGLIFVESYSTEFNSNQKNISPVKFLAKICTVDCATLCSKSDVILIMALVQLSKIATGSKDWII